MHYIIDGDSLLYQSAYKVSTVQAGYEKLLDKLTQITEGGWEPPTFTIFIEGKGNWRKDVFPQYKAQRKNAKVMDPYREIRWGLADHMKEHKLAISANGCESDDLVRRKAVNMAKRGQDYTIVTSDKDLDMIPGKHIRFNPSFDITKYTLTEDDAMYNFYYQLMIGDMQDNIKSPMGLGKKTAEKILDQTPRDQWEQRIEKEYKTRCGSEWEHCLYFTGSLIYIQEHKDAMFEWNNGGTWFDKGFSGIPACYTYSKAQLGE